MRIPVTYACNRVRAEQILLDAANDHTKEVVAMGAAALQSMLRRFTMSDAETEPRVFYRITDNWLELGLRFLAPVNGARALKDAMSRDILRAFDAEGIGIASATYDIVGFPMLRYAADVDSSGTRKARPRSTDDDAS